MSPKQELGVLGMTFTIVRAMQVVSLISIIGMTANFISEMVIAKTNPHQVLIGTLVVVSFFRQSTLLTQILTKSLDHHCCPLHRCHLHHLPRWLASFLNLYWPRLSHSDCPHRRYSHCRQTTFLPRMRRSPQQRQSNHRIHGLYRI